MSYFYLDIIATRLGKGGRKKSGTITNTRGIHYPRAGRYLYPMMRSTGGVLVTLSVPTCLLSISCFSASCKHQPTVSLVVGEVSKQ